jgi:hypothetical protein
MAQMNFKSPRMERVSPQRASACGCECDCGSSSGAGGGGGKSPIKRVQSLARKTSRESPSKSQ